MKTKVEIKPDLYAYGMFARGYAPMCQPFGVVYHVDFDLKMQTMESRPFWSVLWYSRTLGDDEVKNYELVRLEKFDLY